MSRMNEKLERRKKPCASAAAMENRRIAMPRSPTLSLAASTAAQSLHANQPTDPLSSTATHPPPSHPSHVHPSIPRHVSSASITNPSTVTRLSLIPLDRNVHPPPPVQLFSPFHQLSSPNSAAIPPFFPFPRGAAPSPPSISHSCFSSFTSCCLSSLLSCHKQSPNSTIIVFSFSLLRNYSSSSSRRVLSLFPSRIAIFLNFLRLISVALYFCHQKSQVKIN